MLKLISLKVSLFAVACLGLLFGCDKENEKPGSGSKNGLSALKGDNQQGIFGEYLKDTIYLQVSAADTSRKYRIKYEMVQGNGLLKRSTIYPSMAFFEPDKKGIVKVIWKLGCNNNTQKIKFSLYPIEAVSWMGEVAEGQKELASLTISASGREPAGWGQACGFEYLDPFRFNIISHDPARLYLANRGLYFSDDQGMNWYKVDGVPHWDDVMEAQFNSKGWLYVLTRSHGLYYSKDLTSWESINNGILDYRDPTAFTVTDSMLFVSFNFDGPYKTENNGEFWRKMSLGNNSDTYYFIKPHPNGNIYLFDKWADLMMSSDKGKTWKNMNLSYSYVPSELYDFDIAPNGTLYIGSGDATISAISPTSLTGERRSYYEPNGWVQHVNNIQFFKNDAYFLVNISPKAGIYSRNNNWGKVELNFTKPISYFYIKNDGKFLLASDGLYYKK
ncbi:MAG: hypothetical protein ACO1O1_17430 [Adhaeribacter sp.]